MKSDPLPSNKHETIESIKEKFSTQLTSILYERLTVDNIENFADNAINKIIDLNTEILEYYKNSGQLEIHSQLELRDQEDDAYTQLGLPKISNILDLIQQKKSEIDEIKNKIKKEYIDVVITPTGEKEQGIIPGDRNGLEKKKFLPRLLTLMYILENDLEIDLENIKIIEGQNDDNTMRKNPYIKVEIDDLKRLVYICDENDNASYVFNTEKLKENQITLENLDIYSKDNKNLLIQTYLGIGVRVIQTKNWRNKMKGYLENEIPEIGVNEDILSINEIPANSEFKAKRSTVYLPYNKWIQELKTLYANNTNFEGGIRDWYKNEARKHEGWYIDALSRIARKYNVNVDDIYTAIGYERKTEVRDSFLQYEEWIQELKEIYEKTDKTKIISFFDWYQNEAKKHKGWYVIALSRIAKKYNVNVDDIYAAIGYKRKR